MTALRLEVSGRRADLVIDRPEKRNAMSLAMWAALPGLLAQAEAVPGLRLLVLRGAKGCFSAGADIAEFEAIYADRATALATHRTIQAAMTALEQFPAPTLALIEGPCVGGGCGLALACDLRFAAADAQFGITPAKLGIAYGLADTGRLIAAVGEAAAMEILFTGRIFPAAEALRIRLIDRTAEDAGALAAAGEAFAAELEAASSHTARAAKRMRTRIRAGAREEDDASAEAFADAVLGPDFQEGRNAFLAKRRPEFP